MESGEYQAFLESKRMVAPSSGLQVSTEDVHPSLFEFQAALVVWSVRKGRAALWADTGLGKTRCQVEWARLIGQRTLIIAPLSVARQTVREADAIGVEVVYARSQAEVGACITITNYEMADHFDASAFGAVVLDECFAPDTLVDTLTGRKHIKDVRIGEEIISAAGIDTVADVHRREVPYAIRIRVAGQAIISSPNHPYFAERGWVAAQDLVPGDRLCTTAEALCLVRGYDRPEAVRQRQEAVLQSILLSEMAHAPAGAHSEGAYAGGSEEAGRQAPSLVCVGQSQGGSGAGADTRLEPHRASRGAREDQPPIERDAPRTFRAWGQRAWLDAASTDDAGCIRADVGAGVCFVTGQTDSRLSDQLQARLSQSRAENRYRGGWSLAYEQAPSGRQEGYETGFPGVDSLEVLQPGHPDLERYRDADGKLYFYDLGATRHPSFSVAGLLVHNSSILKALGGKTRKALTEQFADTPYRLCCTATPAPNDITELANHAEFLGILRRQDMLAAFFVHDDEGWRLKGHATRPFYRWLASWAMACRTPSDLGTAYGDEGYVLPPLSIEPVWVDADVPPDEGHLFFTHLKGIRDRSRVRQATVHERVETAAALVNASREPWIVWCGLNSESTALTAAIPDAVEVVGSDSPDAKAAALEAFQQGKHRVLVSKAKIAGFGMNFQHCSRMVFVGLSDSWEAYYQCIRRCYRFGQQRPVTAAIVLSRAEEGIYANVMHKETEARAMSEQLISHMGEFERAEISGVVDQQDYLPAVPMHLPAWLLAS